MERIVLVLAAEHLDGALQLPLPTDERVVVRHMVVEARHQRTPGIILLCLLVIAAGSRWAIILTHNDTHEVAHGTVDGTLKHVVGLRILKLQHGIDEVRHTDALSSGVLHTQVGEFQQLLHLCRHGDGGCVTVHFWNTLKGVEIMQQLVVEPFGALGEILQGLLEGFLTQEGEKQVLGHGKLVAVVHGHLPSLFQSLASMF